MKFNSIMTEAANSVDTRSRNVHDPNIKDTSMLLARLLWVWAQRNGIKFSRWMGGLMLFLIMSGTTTGCTYIALLTNRLGNQWAQVRQFFLQRYNLE